MLFGILCILSPIAFIIGYEILKAQKHQTKAAINGTLFIVGFIIVLTILASNSKSSIDGENFARRITSTSQEKVEPARKNKQFETVTSSSIIPELTAQSNLPIKSPKDNDAFLETLLKTETDFRQQLINAFSDVEDNGEYKIQKLQYQLTNITNEINLYKSNRTIFQSAKDIDVNSSMNKQMILLRKQMDSSFTNYRNQINSSPPLIINTYSTTHATPSPYISNATVSTYTTPTTSYSTSSSHLPSTYVNPNSNSNTIEVSGFYRKNGTYVAPYTRTRANHTQTDNFSYRP